MESCRCPEKQPERSLVELVELSLDWSKLELVDGLYVESFQPRPEEQAGFGYQAVGDCRLEGCWA